MTNVSTKYFSTLSPLFDAALCTSKRLYSAVHKMTSIIVDYNDSSIQPFHMLSSSPTTMSMTFKTSDQIPNETKPLWKTYPLFCTHVTSWYYRAKKTQTQQDFWKENGLLHVICVPLNFVQVYHHRTSRWSFWSIRWGGNYNSLASLSELFTCWSITFQNKVLICPEPWGHLPKRDILKTSTYNIVEN